MCDHYNHVRTHLNSHKPDYNYSKQNILILGPTGVGKTYLVKQIAKLVGVPFVKADATRFSETGYVGANVDDLIHDLVGQAGGDLNLSQYGIVYLDEADKLAGHSDQHGKDVNGRGVQFGLLKLMEETDVDLRGGNDMRSQMQAFMEMQKKGKVEPRMINTRHILFIISGAFNGLADIVRERLRATSIGFNRTEAQDISNDDCLALAATADFVRFGFEPEFIGRLPIRVACKPLDVEALYHILKDSEGSIIKQYEASFGAYGIELVFTDGALMQIAELAAKEQTGARALMTVCENLLRDFKFELPSHPIKKLVVDVELVHNPAQRLAECLAESARISSDHERIRFVVARYAEDFLAQYNVRLHFSDDALLALKERGLNDDKLSKFLKQHFAEIEHGLRLIEQLNGKQTFVIDAAAIHDPKRHLERLITEAWAQRQDSMSRQTPVN